MLKYIFIPIPTLILLTIVYTVYKYPYLLEAKTFFEEKPNTYYFEDDYRFVKKFTHFKLTHYSSYEDNVSLMEDNTTKKCPFFYTPDEPVNKKVIFADNHILWENEEPLHSNLRNYVKDFVPDSIETIKRLNNWFEKYPKEKISAVEFEKILYYSLFGKNLNTKDAELVIEFRLITRKVAMLPPFIRNIFMSSTLDRIQEIKLYFENKMLSDGFKYPQTMSEVFWFNAAPLYNYYERLKNILAADKNILSEVKNASKTTELIEEIFRLFPIVCVFPYNKNGELYGANISLANIDSTVFKNPLEIDLNREHYNHLTFASPSKRGCVGRGFSTNFLAYLIERKIENIST